MKVIAVLNHSIDPEMLEYVSFEMVEEAEVKVLFHSFVVGPIVEGKAVKGVILENKSGRQAVCGKVTVNATGDGDLAAAGVPFEKRKTKDLQPATLMFS